MQSAYKQTVTKISAAAFLRSAIDIPESASSKNARRQVVNVFLRLFGGKFTSFSNISYDFLAEWVIKMAFEGYSLKTAAYYLKILSAIYTDAVSAGLADPTVAFADLGLRLNSLSSFGETEQFDFKALKHFVRSLADRVVSSSLSENIALYAIIGGGLTAESVAKLKRDDFRAEIPLLEEIKKHYARPRVSYLFPLRRNDCTITALSREVESRMQSVLTSAGMTGGADFLWSAAAVSIGVDPGAVLSIIGHVPAGAPVFELVEPRELSEEERCAVIVQVADAIIDNPVQWLAMQLRPGVKFEEMMTLSQLATEAVYYPMKKVAKRLGSRLTFENKPIIPGLVFFRTRLTDVPDLFRRIGSLAWVYRLNDSSASPYAVIPPEQMRGFQLAIGVFSSDIDAATAQPLKPGDTVEFIGGNFRGLTARIQTVAPTVYRLLLPAFNGIEWRIDADPRILLPEFA